MHSPSVAARPSLANRGPSEPANARWKAALARFNSTRLTLETTDIDEEGGDEVVDLYCEAMDDLVATPAPNAEAFFFKFKLVRERFEKDGFATPTEYNDAFEADVRRLLGCSPAPFDAVNWIKRATEAGATMFVRGEEMWIGMLAQVGNTQRVESLKAELDDERRSAVRDVLAARGLVCEEA